MIIKRGTLILLADGRKVVLLRNEGSATSPLLAKLVEQEADNPRTHEQGSDRPGRTQSRVGERRSSYGDTDWQEQGEQLFLREVARLLEDSATDESGAEIVVVAPPVALGELRGHYGRNTARMLKGEIAKDLVHHDSDAILAAIEEFEPA